MKYAWLGCLFVGSLLFAGTQDSELNVNTRYTVETVIVAGKGWTDQRRRISRRPDQLRLAQGSGGAGRAEAESRHSGRTGHAAARRSTHAREVSHHVLRGKTPDHVRVEFEVEPGPRGHRCHRHQVRLRFQAGLERRRRGGTSRSSRTPSLSAWSATAIRLDGALRRNLRALREQAPGHRPRGLRFQFESYHEQWNQNTLERLGGAARTRLRTPTAPARTFEPTATIVAGQAADAEIGVRFRTLSEPVSGRATESANAADHHSALSSAAGGFGNQQDLDAGYTLRAATKVLGTDFVYTSHRSGCTTASRTASTR